jgi:hypothetical protein
MDKLRIATAAFAILAGAGMMAGTASAMPLNGQLAVTAPAATDAQQVRWVCGPYRCWWQPGGYYYPGPRWGYGWRGGWRGGWHGGWHRRWR